MIAKNPTTIAVLLIMLTLPGCAVNQAVELGPPGRDGRVYYLDGAGGGGGLTNWGNGVRDGLKSAGYEGDFVNYRWQSGAGVGVDQVSPVGGGGPNVADGLGFPRRHHRHLIK